ncbi:AT-rich interactive domain-containing protein 3A [Oryzias melastigma]|uniref:AT-rich interactive domain-containing protein 3 n=1 Tax=Oryzias melastigma TaxID=30732 RepID=A0A834FP42_ORYME|nr:AT-rich interactive domain-containing protein 3A [Oryzias melastigma]
MDRASAHPPAAARGALSPGCSLPTPASPASCSSPHSAAASQQPPSGGMKLEAVMEHLQRQQAARLALEEQRRQAERDQELRSHIQRQALAFCHYQTAVRSALSAGDAASAAALPPMLEEDADSERRAQGGDAEEQEVVDGEGEDGVMLSRFHLQARLPPRSAVAHPVARVPPGFMEAPCAESPPARPQSQHEWTYEEQFKQVSWYRAWHGPELLQPGTDRYRYRYRREKQRKLFQRSKFLYELDDDEKRKEFLDDLFSFMQRRGTPVNRIPIMAKQVLDLYMLYKLVTEKGGLVEVINKKIWREITKGLNLPTSITSAAFTLRTQYMKYLYPYECEKRGLSSPAELQAAIDSNRREGRRQSYGSVIFSYSPAGTPGLLSSPKMQPHLSMLGPGSSRISQTPMVKTEEPMVVGCLPSRAALAVLPGGHHAAAVTQAAALEQLRETLQAGEPPLKKMVTAAGEQQRMVEQNLIAVATQLPLKIKVNSRDDRQETALNLSTNGISSINMSIEINGVVYTDGCLDAVSGDAGLWCSGLQCVFENVRFYCFTV